MKKCPSCGFEEHEIRLPEDMRICIGWVRRYLSDKKVLPNKEEFEAMQREGLLPTHREMSDGSGNTFELNYGHYGWAVDYNWSNISTKILTASQQC